MVKKRKGPKPKTQEQATADFIKKHGNKFNYSRMVYINRITKILIICNKCHTEFLLSPKNHLMNSAGGCPKRCWAKSTRFTEEEFRNRCFKVHGNNYSYSKAKYKGIHKKILIICNECENIFKQKPDNHLQGQGCPHVCYDNEGKPKILSIIRKGLKINGTNYDYSICKRITSKNKYGNYRVFLSDIICNECKTVFTKDVYNHVVNGQGCPWKCYIDLKASRGSNKKYNTLLEDNDRYSTPGKENVTEMMFDIIGKYVGNDFNFLSLPGNGRELLRISKAFNIDIENSLGVELYQMQYRILQHLIKKNMGMDMPLLKGDVDKLILDGEIHNKFRVSHLDYNGPLIQRRWDAINKLVDNTEKDGLVFITLNNKARHGTKLNKVLAPDNSCTIMDQNYEGMRHANMTTLGFLKTN